MEKLTKIDDGQRLSQPNELFMSNEELKKAIDMFRNYKPLGGMKSKIITMNGSSFAIIYNVETSKEGEPCRGSWKITEFPESLEVFTPEEIEYKECVLFGDFSYKGFNITSVRDDLGSRDSQDYIDWISALEALRMELFCSKK